MAANLPKHDACGASSHERGFQMKRMITLGAAVLAAAAVATGSAGAQPIGGSPASCAGYLAAYANPNNGYVIHAIAKPLAEELGLTLGGLQRTNAQRHEGDLDTCIP